MRRRTSESAGRLLGVRVLAGHNFSATYTDSYISCVKSQRANATYESGALVTHDGLLRGNRRAHATRGTNLVRADQARSLAAVAGISSSGLPELTIQPSSVSLRGPRTLQRRGADVSADSLVVGRVDPRVIETKVVRAEQAEGRIG